MWYKLGKSDFYEAISFSLFSLLLESRPPSQLVLSRSRCSRASGRSWRARGILFPANRRPPPPGTSPPVGFPGSIMQRRHGATDHQHERTAMGYDFAFDPFLAAFLAARSFSVVGEDGSFCFMLHAHRPPESGYEAIRPPYDTRS